MNGRQADTLAQRRRAIRRIESIGKNLQVDAGDLADTFFRAHPCALAQLSEPAVPETALLCMLQGLPEPPDE